MMERHLGMECISKNHQTVYSSLALGKLTIRQARLSPLGEARLFAFYLHIVELCATSIIVECTLDGESEVRLLKSSLIKQRTSELLPAEDDLQIQILVWKNLRIAGRD